MTSAPATPSTPFDDARKVAAATDPSGVTFALKTVGNKTRFAAGERIELELAFTSAVAETYVLDMAEYDRSGRMDSDEFHVDPATGVVDPLADYFVGGRAGGGLRKVPPMVANQALSIHLTANEWLRFDRPGHYRIYLTSTRVGQVRRPDDGTRALPVLHATSNIVELDVDASTQWADEELPQVTAAIAAGKDDEVRSAARYALRFLPTKAAVQAMVDDLCHASATQDRYTWNTEAGLFGSPFRDEVLRALTAGLKAPGCAVDRGYMQLLGRLQLAGKHDESIDFRDVMFGLAKVVIDALPGKTDLARASSTYAALQAVRDKGLGAESPETKQLRSSLIASFHELPDDAVARLLTDEWALVRSPAVATPVVALAREARDRGGLLRSLSDLALERWLELDYTAARKFILAELARAGGPRTSFSGKTLGRLRDRELPTLDASLVALLKLPESDGVSLELHAEVVARYASRAVLADIWAGYKAVAYFRMSLLSYLARHDAKRADVELQALRSFDDLWRVSNFLWNATMESRCIKFLDGADANRAASLLAQKGTARAERSLWDRLTALHAEGKDSGSSPAAIRQAIVDATAWMTPPAKLAELALLCPSGPTGSECTKRIQDAVERWGDDGKHPVLVLWATDPEHTSGWIAQYNFSSKVEVLARIAQLPKGVSLAWSTKPADVDAAVLAEIKSLAKSRQVQIVSKP